MYEVNVMCVFELGVQYGGGKVEWDNIVNMVEQFMLCIEEVYMFGYCNFGEVLFVLKMVDLFEDVLCFLGELVDCVCLFVEKDWEELQVFVKIMFGIDKFELWDMVYVLEKLCEVCYVFFEQEVKQYFLEFVVLDGLFNVVQMLFLVKIQLEVVEVWYLDVCFFCVELVQGELLVQFYIDLYVCEGKCGGVWMDDVCGCKLLGEVGV